MCIYLLWNGTFVVYLTPIVFHNLNTWLKTCTQILKPTPINVYRGTHTSLHLFVVYAGFKSFYIIILQWVQFNVQWRYNVSVYMVYRAGQGLGPYIQYKDYWQVSIVYLNFDVIIRIRIKSKGQRCLNNWIDATVVQHSPSRQCCPYCVYITEKVLSFGRQLYFPEKQSPSR